MSQINLNNEMKAKFMAMEQKEAKVPPPVQKMPQAVARPTPPRQAQAENLCDESMVAFKSQTTFEENEERMASGMIFAQGPDRFFERKRVAAGEEDERFQKLQKEVADKKPNLPKAAFEKPVLKPASQTNPLTASNPGTAGKTMAEQLAEAQNKLKPINKPIAG